LPFVVDASVALCWCFEDEVSAYADGVLARLESENAIAPILWHKEIANVLTMAARSRRITEEKVAAGGRLVQSLPVNVANLTPGEVHGSVAELAKVYHLTVYDAAYLYLAVREGLALATLDDDLIAAAPKAGVPLLQP
jgi:predicted nucleic acid-binding protein